MCIPMTGLRLQLRVQNRGFQWNRVHAKNGGSQARVAGDEGPHGSVNPETHGHGTKAQRMQRETDRMLNAKNLFFNPLPVTIRAWPRFAGAGTVNLTSLSYPVNSALISFRKLSVKNTACMLLKTSAKIIAWHACSERVTMYVGKRMKSGLISDGFPYWNSVHYFTLRSKRSFLFSTGPYRA